MKYDCPQLFLYHIMAFLGTDSLKALLSGKDVITPLNSERIKNGAYELSLGAQVFQTDSSPRAVKELKKNEKIEIKPGQFALLLTAEYVKIPNDKIAFISIKAGVKFKGLINVSGFHVDPGFEGNLLFSVYNAGPSSIVLSNGTPYFPIWFSELNEKQEYKGRHEKQASIPDEPVSALSQGELTSPNVLSKRIEDLKHFKTKLEWVVLAIFAAVLSLTIKFWTDSNKIKEAIEFGYNKKTEEISKDSTYMKVQFDINVLKSEVEGLKQVSPEEPSSLNPK